MELIIFSLMNILLVGAFVNGLRNGMITVEW